MDTTRNERLYLFPSRGESNDASTKEFQIWPGGFIQNSMKLLSICKGKDNNATGRFEC